MCERGGSVRVSLCVCECGRECEVCRCVSVGGSVRVSLCVCVSVGGSVRGAGVCVCEGECEGVPTI